ncbi:DUF4174 domain-containing protein [Pseudooceanicola sp.]|uniref:DUF4174 domain-containing protein n=1 Tax=Pseudooceanicola sp. TaxID=1914328 RepID=UPI0040589512
MPRILPLIGLALGAGGLAAATLARAADTPLFTPLAAETGDLDAYRWEKRPVLVFAPSPEDPTFRRQIDLLERARPGLRDRDIVVLTDAAPGALGRLRTGLALEGFAVLLVGKDGGVKLRDDAPVAPERLFALIDRMPMRQREMAD